jgi:signal transduction histidine kinase
MRVVFVPNSLSLLWASAVIQLVLIAALVAQWRRGRRSVHLLVQQRAGTDERTGALVHELNQPLTAILSNAQAAQRFLAAGQLDLQELRAILDDIVTDDKRAAGIVRNIGVILQQSAGSRAGLGSKDDGVGKSGIRKERPQ